MTQKLLVLSEFLLKEVNYKSKNPEQKKFVYVIKAMITQNIIKYRMKLFFL